LSGSVCTVIFGHDLDLDKGPETVNEIQRKRGIAKPVVLPPLVYFSGFFKPEPAEDLLENFAGFNGRVKLFACLEPVLAEFPYSRSFFPL